MKKDLRACNPRTYILCHPGRLLMLLLCVLLYSTGRTVVDYRGVIRVGLERFWSADGFLPSSDIASYSLRFFGNESLSTAIEFLKENRIAKYRISPAWNKDAFLNQRLIEGAWPKRPVGTARHMIALKAEPLPSGCGIVRERADVVLLDCD